MATMADAVYQGRKPMKCPFVLTQKETRTRNVAVLSALGVISGAYMVFRFLAPQRGTLNTSEEVAAFQGSPGQTAQGDTTGHTARAPRKG
ncbi:hypothetical protein N7489_000182 [Penicillium chrysogenum]|uniref:Cytochrome c oxidase assembly factor n=1 Tax=Penicillium chrysogenum TaxID=5076 RepID=A0ABQ8WFR4_PENCH|nr:uncharacterized protein N7489_000182 [Penicillium chrysogenum]KAJ5249772.1 hypothetical protein N7489_000182 [Penicillium chrysogenum]KAJ5265365.1 hypothetical protein N7524_006383 [Penicillium chrysogenum]KAJ5268677.1 hypothetical protein N7505_004435 [Penicillium chrysogenum]